MAIQTLNTIKKWFKTSSKPSQDQFWDTWDSFRHKYEKVPIKDIEELETTLDTKAEKSQLDDHKNDQIAHAGLFSGKEDKYQKGVAGGYVPLDEFSKIAHQYLNLINNLTAGGENSILSAEQGVVLQNQIDNINRLLKCDNVDLDTVQKIVDAVTQIQTSIDTILVNDLTTGGITKALTAEMGKVLDLNKEDKSQKGIANGYVPLDEFSKIAHQYLSIVNNLTAGGATSSLSAEQGVVLQSQIDGILTVLSSDNINLDTIQEIVDAIETVQVSLSSILVNDLTTGGVTKALTAEMGKFLDQIKLTATLATDAETQIMAVVPEDNKVVSRSKLFNWWENIKATAQTISHPWIFSDSIMAKAATFENVKISSLKGTLIRQLVVNPDGTLSSSPISTQTKRYVGMITQSGTDAPMVNININTFPDNVIWKRLQIGTYEGSFDFMDYMVNSLVCLNNHTENGFICFRQTSGNTVLIETFDLYGNLTDGKLTDNTISIELFKFYYAF